MVKEMKLQCTINAKLLLIKSLKIALVAVVEFHNFRDTVNHEAEQATSAAVTK